MNAPKTRMGFPWRAVVATAALALAGGVPLGIGALLKAAGLARSTTEVLIDAESVNSRVQTLSQNADLSRFVL